MSENPDKKVNPVHVLLIVIISACLFIPFLGGVHLFDWDEINFAESAREMIMSGNYLTVQINYIPFWEKPPLFIWMQVVSMKVFGINEFAARMPNAVGGILTLLVLYFFGCRIKDRRFGITWVIMYAGSMLPFIYFKSGIIDPWFNLFIFAGIYQFHLYFESKQRSYQNAALSAFFLGLAIITKGPVALLVFIITFVVFLLVRRFKVEIKLPHVLVFALILTVTGGLWFILQILQGNFTIIADFIEYQIRLFQTKDAGHGGFLLYHFVVLFLGVFPASIFALPALFPSKYRSVSHNGFYIWMLILFWVVLILFTVVKTKIVHYSSLCYFPLTFFATWALYHGINTRLVWTKIIQILTVIVGMLIAMITSTLTFMDSFKEWLIQKDWIKDPFAVANLSASGNWQGYEFITGFILIGGIVLFIVKGRKNFEFGARILALSTAIFIFFSLFLIVPRIEAYSQRAAIEFFKSVSNKDAYLTTLGYKSYAHLFYGEARNHSHSKATDKEWLLKGTIDKPVYFSSKITRRDKIRIDYPDVKLLYEKNGFAFFVRHPE